MLNLLTVADDVGLCSEINQTVAEAAERGCIRATSMLVGAPAFEDAVRRLRDVPGISHGLHLSLVETPTVRGELPSFSSWRGFVAALAMRRISMATVRAELNAQFEQFCASGLRLSHVNGHQHLHIVPGILEMVAALCQTHGVRYVRVPDERALWPRPFGALALQALGGRARRVLEDRRLLCADRFVGFTSAGRLTYHTLARMVARLCAPVTELSCHLGRASQVTRTWGYQWDDESAALTDPSFAERLAARDVRLCTVDDIVNASDARGGRDVALRPA